MAIKRRCPKCGSARIELSRLGVRFVCKKCRHKWTPRKRSSSKSHRVSSVKEDTKQ